MIINMNLWNDIVTDRGMYLFQKSVYLFALFVWYLLFLFLFLLALGISVMVVTILVRSIVTIDAIRWFSI